MTVRITVIPVLGFIMEPYHCSFPPILWRDLFCCQPGWRA